MSAESKLMFLSNYLRPGLSVAQNNHIQSFITEAENYYNVPFPKWEEFKNIKLTSLLGRNFIYNLQRVVPNFNLPKKDTDIKREIWKMQIRKVLKRIDPALYDSKNFENTQSEIVEEPRYYNDKIFDYSFNGDEFEWMSSD